MASQDHPVIVGFRRESGEVWDFDMGAAALPRLTIDRKGFTKDQLGNDHYGSRLLCAASLACFTNTFANALIRQGVNLKGMNAKAEIEKDKDDYMRTRFTVIHMDVEVVLDEKDRPIFESVDESMKSGSLVTYSLQDAIEMDIHVRMVAS
ncbi:MAG: OsmC family protein [Thermodesulfobacteriota bacterium]